MTFLSARRVLSACVVSAAAVAALAAPGTASASDLGTQCSGSNIEGNGSTFQAPAQKIWNPKFNESGLSLACNGTQGSLGKPTVVYNQGTGNTGSGACLKAFGVESATTKYKEFPFCGTDEAPNPKQKGEIEAHAGVGVEERSLETIPVAQGAVAVIVNLPTGCRAQSEIVKGTKKFKLGRLVFNHTTLEGIYRGTIKTWKAAVEAQGGDGADKLTCTGGTAEEETTIKPIVRRDKSGTTHIFKAYLAQVNTEGFTAEEFNEPEEGSGKKPCGAVLPEEEKTWAQVSEGCENQRWPAAAKIIRPTANGNPALIAKVAETPSSIGYGDLAVVRENGEFSKKFNKETGKGGGENKKGSETKLGEQNERFWVEIQDSAPGVKPVLYAEPASNGDIEKAANSNCAGTVYAAKPGEKFPPKNTRETWFAAKAEITQKKYSICGLTYDLALRQYFYYLNPEGVSETASKEKATTVENYLLWVLNSKSENGGGGGFLLKNHDYEKLSGTVLKEAETGVKEIGNKIA